MPKSGLAATGYTSGSDVYEIVLYVGTDNSLNFGIVVNDGVTTWYHSSAPTGKTLTGKLAATTFVYSPYRYLLVGLTTTDGKLYRYVANLSLGVVGAWADSSAGLNWSPSFQLSASAGGSGAVGTIYGAHTPSSESLGMLRWTGSGWAITNLGRPSGKRACRSIAAAEGNLTGLSTGYRVLIACTSFLVVPEVYVATATSETATSVTWHTYASPNSLYYQNVTAVLRPASVVTAAKAIDVYLSGILQNRLHKATQTSSSFSIIDLGSNPDGGLADFAAGDLVAVARGTSSRAFFVDRLNGRDYLYERYGGTTAQIPQAYRAFDRGNVSSETATTSDHTAEAKASSWQGIMAVNAMRRPGTGGPTDWPTVHLSYADASGFYPDVTVTNTAGGNTHEYVADPTVAVTDQRNIYGSPRGLVGRSRPVMDGVEVNA